MEQLRREAAAQQDGIMERLRREAAAEQAALGPQSPRSSHLRTTRATDSSPTSRGAAGR